MQKERYSAYRNRTAVEGVREKIGFAAYRHAELFHV